MQKDFLVFRIYAPLASWGDIAVGGQRFTLGHPTKSAVLGLVAAALGTDRAASAKHQTLHDALGLAWRVDQKGEVLSDYHTTQVVPRPALGKVALRSRRQAFDVGAGEEVTILSTREYLQEHCVRIALWSRDRSDDASLENITQALMKPAYALYVGRRSCSLGLPLMPQIVTAAAATLALDDAIFPDDSFLKLAPRGFLYGWEYGSSHLQAQEQVRRRDGLINRSSWLFDEREFSIAWKSRTNGGGN